MPARVSKGDAVLTYGLGIAALWLSYTALVDLAVRAGLSERQAAVWPLVIDGLILAATRAVVTFGDHPERRYAWRLLWASAIVSVAGNAVHAVLPDGPAPTWVTVAVGIAPPIAALAITHLAVVRARVRADLADLADDATPDAPLETPVTHDATPALEVPEVLPAEPVVEAPVEDVAEPATHASMQADTPDASRDMPVTHDVTHDASPAPVDTLTRDEHIEQLATQGLSNYAIGAIVGVSESTVRRRLRTRVTL